jgi:hypothetical protein
MKKLFIFLLRVLGTPLAVVVALGCLLLTLLTGNGMFLNGSQEVFAILWTPNEDTYKPFY